MNTAPGAIAAFSRLGDYLTTRIGNDYIATRLRALYPPEKILLVWGAQDKAVPLSVAHECCAALGEPALAIIENANHVPYFEQPTAFDAALLPFLASVSQVAAP